MIQCEQTFKSFGFNFQIPLLTFFKLYLYWFDLTPLQRILRCQWVDGILTLLLPGQWGSVFVSEGPDIRLRNSAGPGNEAGADRGARRSGFLVVEKETAGRTVSFDFWMKWRRSGRFKWLQENFTWSRVTFLRWFERKVLFTPCMQIQLAVKAHTAGALLVHMWVDWVGVTWLDPHGGFLLNNFFFSFFLLYHSCSVM